MWVLIFFLTSQLTFLQYDGKVASNEIFELFVDIYKSS